jgi:hypothetical protein
MGGRWRPCQRRKVRTTKGRKQQLRERMHDFIISAPIWLPLSQLWGDLLVQEKPPML